jgi:hypothetical protein
MFQYAYCRELQRHLPNSSLEGYNIPEFGLQSQATVLQGRVLHIPSGHFYPMDFIAHKLRERIYDALLFDGYVQRLEYHVDREKVSSLFASNVEVAREALGQTSLLINVRGNEVLSDLHPDYGPVPVSYFEQIANETSLDPIIMGQIGDDEYSREIRRRFSGCRFLGKQSPVQDFQTVRNATNIVVSVSSFSWLAAWLSSTAENIYLPVSGFLNPEQRPDIDLLPISDSRYHFYEFPMQRWRATPEQLEFLLFNRRLFPKFTRERLRMHLK